MCRLKRPKPKAIVLVRFFEYENLARIAAVPLSAGRQVEAPHLIMVKIHLFFMKVYSSRAHSDLLCLAKGCVLRKTKEAAQFDRELHLA
jgi:hypothetical protein